LTHNRCRATRARGNGHLPRRARVARDHGDEDVGRGGEHAIRRRDGDRVIGDAGDRVSE
jgi:hypothetical protein